MAKEYLTITQAGSSSKSMCRALVMVSDDNPFYKQIEKYGNPSGLVSYRSRYDASAKELIFCLAPDNSRRVKNAAKSKPNSKRKSWLYQLALYFRKTNTKLLDAFKTSSRIPTGDCYFEDSSLHIPIKQYQPLNISGADSKHDSGKHATDAVAKELAKRLALQADDLVSKLEDSIVATLNSDDFISKLAGEIAFKQTPQLTTKLNRIQEQNSASNKQLKEELSKKFASAVKQLIDYWNK